MFTINARLKTNPNNIIVKRKKKLMNIICVYNTFLLECCACAKIKYCYHYSYQNVLKNMRFAWNIKYHGVLQKLAAIKLRNLLKTLIPTVCVKICDKTERKCIIEISQRHTYAKHVPTNYDDRDNIYDLIDKFLEIILIVYYLIFYDRYSNCSR